MKPFKNVEKTRIEYHTNVSSNAVHRSSLLVPVVGCNIAELSLLNHFLIKRGYEKIVCKISAISDHGDLIDSLDFMLTEKKVYKYNLDEMFSNYKQKKACYNVEFYSHENLFIPYTAAMINHVSDKCVNQVHAYNRILNDVFEDIQVNKTPVKEACIDVFKDETAETFINFNAGISNINDKLIFELSVDGGEIIKREFPVMLPRLNSQIVKFSEIYPELDSVKNGFLRVLSPKQFMFYGRVLCGIVDSDGNIVANHSYYDTSSIAEYWNDNVPSSRNYPFHPNLEMVFRIYPILSPGNYRFEVSIILKHKKVVISSDILSSPGNTMLELNVNSLIEKANIDISEVYTVQLSATNEVGPTPTRVTHQLIYRALGSNEGISSSVNISLLNRNVFMPQKKTGLSWGQVIVGRNIKAYVGVTAMYAYDKKIACTVKLYSDEGLIYERKIQIDCEQSIWMDVSEIVNSMKDRDYIWYWVTSDHPSVSVFSVSQFNQSGYVISEHSF